jgi:uncharacterized protein with PIN domain
VLVFCVMFTKEDSPGPASRWPTTLFICDQHLGALARLLRQMGFDVVWRSDLLEAEMARVSLNENRVALSRNRQLFERKALGPALHILSDDPDTQAAQVLAHFQLVGEVCFFSRCSACGGIIDDVDRDEVAAEIPPRTRAWLDTYYRCRDCGKLYWEGTHITALRARLDAIVARAAGKGTS